MRKTLLLKAIAALDAKINILEAAKAELLKLHTGEKPKLRAVKAEKEKPA